MNPIALPVPSVVVAVLAALSKPQINGICARWANRRIPGSEAYGLLQLQQLGPTPYPGANQADRMDAAVAHVCRPRLQVPGT